MMIIPLAGAAAAAVWLMSRGKKSVLGADAGSTSVRGPSGTLYMVAIGDAGQDGRRQHAVWGAEDSPDGPPVLVYLADADGGRRSVLEGSVRAGAAGDLARSDFGF